MLHSRLKRVEGEYKQELAKIIAYSLSDPRVEFVTVTRVKISKDLREAIVHISPLQDDPEKAQEAIDALEAAKGFIKRHLATQISLKRLPDPHFKLDTTTRDAYRLFNLMEEIKHEEEVPPEE